MNDTFTSLGEAAEAAVEKIRARKEILDAFKDLAREEVVISAANLLYAIDKKLLEFKEIDKDSAPTWLNPLRDAVAKAKGPMAA